MEREEGQKPPTRSEPSGELLGPYVLLNELARGELTTVHLAKKQGPLGFQRLVAVKRLRPEYAKQAACIELLVDEARLTAGLHHANVVAVHDVGSEGGCYVISDYIEGENLERVLIRAGTTGHPRFVLPVLVDALNGLHAVHNAMGEDDEPLHMVHQAPCARHIVVGIDGIGRLTDFSQVRARGIAPSRVRSERLRVAYMAPEQALHPDRVDHRADLFIVGIALWEALTGERLFAAETDERTFQNLLHRRIPRPSEVGMRPPRSFDSLCMRALERDPGARFGSALEMARELRDVALNQALYALPGEIGAWVKSVMGRELVERRRKLGDMSSQEISLAGIQSAQQVDPHRDDPYLNGRIYGGASAPAHGAVSSDQGRPGLFPIQRDDEPTAPRYLAFHSLNEIPRPPRRARVSTPPYGAFSDSVVARMPERASSEAQDSAVVEKPQALVEFGSRAEPPASTEVDLERTKPNRVSSSASAAPAAALASGPGTYSHVAESHRKRASKPPQPPAAKADAATPQPQPAEAAFDELATGRHTSVTAPTARPPARSKQSSLPPPSHMATLTGRPRSSTPGSLPPPLPRRATPVIETQPVADLRRDSVPTPLGIPAEPVGVPHGAKAPLHAEPLPPTLESMRTSVTQADELILPRAIAPAPSSLTPPNTAERTLPPEAPSTRAKPWRSGTVWGTSALAAIILLAAGIEVRKWARGDEHAASANPGLSVEATGLDAQPNTEAPSPAKDQAALPPTSVDAAELARPQALSEEAKALPSLAPQQEEHVQPAPSIAKDATAKPARTSGTRASASSVGEPAVEAGGSTREQNKKDVTRHARTKTPEQVPATVTRKPKLAPKSPIPDNPY